MDSPSSKALRPWSGDLWGGLASMLVAMPSAIAFGVSVYGLLGGTYAALGALAGILGTVALGLLASTFGGTDRLITAPCAPAAAVLGGVVLVFLQQGMTPGAIILSLAVIGLASGAIQIFMGLIGVGGLIKYIPYPVVSGYMSGVGLTIMVGQLPIVLGADKHLSFWHTLSTPAAWHWQSIWVGIVVVLAMIWLPRFIRIVPAAILAMLLGTLAYGLSGFLDPALWNLSGNPFVIGPLDRSVSLFEGIKNQWQSIHSLDSSILPEVMLPALTLAILLSIDTLKTCVVLDALTGTHHEPNRELVGQGLGNIGSALIGGMPGAGQMGASMVNLSSGACTRRSGLVEGVFALVAFLLLSGLVAWIPIAALGGILLVVGFRMIDRHSLAFYRSEATRFDLGVILAVIIVALAVGLIAASATGIALSIILFLREQTHNRVLRRKLEGNEIFSRVVRNEQELEILQRYGGTTVVVELQGSLFFGTASQLYRALEPEIGKRTYVILNMRRVLSMDITATHVLEQIKDRLSAAGAYLVFTEIPRGLPSGLKMKRYLREVGLVGNTEKALAFRQLEDALEWVESQHLNAGHYISEDDDQPLDLPALERLLKWKPGTLTQLGNIIENRHYQAGSKLLGFGDISDELVFIRSGKVRVEVPLEKKGTWHIGTFGRGDFLGEMGFLDNEHRSADAVALNDLDCFVLSRERFDALAGSDGQMPAQIFEGIAETLAMRLRMTTKELRAMRS